MQAGKAIAVAGRLEAAALGAFFGKSGGKPLGHAGGYEAGDIAAQPADLLDEARGDELVPVRGHEEHGLDRWIEAGVHAGHLELIFEVADRAQAAQDHAGPHRLGEMHQQGIEGAHLHLAVTGGQIEGGNLRRDHGHALMHVEEGPLADIGRNADDQPVGQAGCAADDVDMAVGDGVEGARIDGDAGLAQRASPASPWASSSARWATETTRSPSATLNSTTPWVLRPTMRISWTGQRISWPPSVTNMI